MFVVIIHDMYLRTVKVRSSSGSIHEYVRVVEAYRDNGKVKQRTLADLGRKDLLVEILPKLQRFLGGDRADTAEAEDPDILDTSTWGPVLVVRTLFDQLGLWTILDAALGKAKGVPFADRAFVLIANRLIRPASEHRLAGWLETDFLCDRRGRRFVPHWHQHQRVRVHFQQLEGMVPHHGPTRGRHEIADPTGLQVLKKCRVSGRRHFCHPTSFQGRGCENGRSTEDPASGS